MLEPEDKPEGSVYTQDQNLNKNQNQIWKKVEI